MSMDILPQIEKSNNEILKIDMAVAFNNILHVRPTPAASVNGNNQYIIASGDIPYKTGLRLNRIAGFTKNMPLPV